MSDQERPLPSPEEAGPGEATAPAERWLWDKSGPPDPEVAALERLLSPLAHDGSLPSLHPGSSSGSFPGSVLVVVLVLALVPAAGLALRQLLRPPTRGPAQLPPTVDAPADPPAPRPAALPVVVADSGAPLRPGEWIEAVEAERVLELDRTLGRFTLAPRTRLRLERADAEATRLYLQRGQLDAYVSIDARPRFFQVETPATTCVDLGCHYTLTVDETTGAAEVTVRTGRVVFESHGREVYVPTGATCAAWRDTGPGTPCFVDDPDPLRDAARAWDQERQATGPARLDLAGRLLALLEEPRHSLTAWHLLQDPDAAVVAAARTTLSRLLGVPGPRPSGDATEREAWKELCVEHWPGAW